MARQGAGVQVDDRETVAARQTSTAAADTYGAALDAAATELAAKRAAAGATTTRPQEA